MTLRDPHFIGTVDPRDLSGPPATAPDPPVDDASQQADAHAAAAAAVPSRQGRTRRPTAPSAAAAVASPGAPSASLVAPRAFVQILSPPAVAVRIARASHALARAYPKFCHQKTIVGALIARDIPDPDDPIVLAAMAALLARWRQDPMDDERCSRRLGWHLPLPLSDRLKTLLWNLRETHHALRPSATALLTAIIWYEVDADSAEGYEALANLVAPYYQRWERPHYELIAP